MPATQEIALDSKIGVLAGGGMLPESVCRACEARGQDVFVVAFEGQTQDSLLNGRAYVRTALGKVGTVISALKERGIEHLVMAGGIKRPGFFELKPDWKAVQILARIGTRALGDDSLLRVLRAELEKEGFILHGAHELAQNLVAGEGGLGDVSPVSEDMESIDLGIKASQALGALDVGQAVIVQQGRVIALEGVEGTQALIERCAGLLSEGGRGGILVKTCKPQQDKDMDMPAIGPDTVEQAHKAGLCGIVIHAGASLVLDAKAVAQVANKYKIFVLGVCIPQPF